MTREQVETLLAKLERWDQYADFEGSFSMGPCENGEPGEYVLFDDVREMLEGMIDAREAVLVASGVDLDAIGSRPEIDLPRNGIETDHDYRNRLIERMREG